jgi:hypothetical protein
MTRLSRTTSLRAGILCVRMARLVSNRDPELATRLYGYAWEAFTAWSQT